MACSRVTPFSYKHVTRGSTNGKQHFLSKAWRDSGIKKNDQAFNKDNHQKAIIRTFHLISHNVIEIDSLRLFPEGRLVILSSATKRRKTCITPSSWEDVDRTMRRKLVSAKTGSQG